MKILYIIPRYDRTAIANQIHTEIIHIWRQYGIETEILSFSYDCRNSSRSVEDDIVVHRFPSGSSFGSRTANRVLASIFPYPYLAATIFGIHSFFSSNDTFDLCHIETAFPLGWATLLSGKRIPPLAITLPGADVMAEPAFDYGYARFRIVRKILPFVFRRASLIRADSPMIRDVAINLGASAAKVVAIPYNITNSSLPPSHLSLSDFRAHSRSVIVKRHQLDPNRPIVVSLNRLHPFKGIVYLVEALPSVRAFGLNPHVLIIGPNRTTPRFGDYGQLLLRRATELSVLDQVMLIGAIPQREAITYLAAADVVVVPSVAEAFSRVVMEACAVGTPPIVTRTTGASFYVSRAKAGIVVEPCAGSAIAEALVTLLSDLAMWHSCSENALALAPQFTSSHIAKQLADLYCAVVS